jgi:DNA-binding NarL/FixJ family response regulator
MMKKIRVLIVDDHQIMRHGVSAILQAEEDMEVCGEVATGREAVEAASKLQPDVIIMDIAMPDLNGLEATRRIRQENAGIEILILTAYQSEALARNVLHAGARGYLLKSDLSHNLPVAVRTVGDHRAFVTERFADIGSGDLGKGPSAPISSREREIVQLLAEGKSNKEIAGLLDISARTVETHRANIMLKLGVHSMSELVRYAIRNHIIEGH